MLSIKSSNWRITTKKDYQLFNPLIIPSMRIKTNPGAKSESKILQQPQSKELNITYRTSKRYSTDELQHKIRSRIISIKNASPSPQNQSTVDIGRQRFNMNTLDNGSRKKKYLFNFYHRNRQFSIRRPNKLTKMV